MPVNPYGAYTRLRDNSKSAMMAAIEIYNKPKFDYREECCVILFLNSWELVLKALLSKNKVRIYYPKKRNQDYRTFSLTDSLREAKQFFPQEVEYDGVRENILALAKYRNNAIHFYNVDGLSAVVYSLAQACIKNYCDLLKSSFSVDMVSETNVVLLPLSLGRMPFDPIHFIDQGNASGDYSKEVSEFLGSIGAAWTSLDSNGADVSRLLVSFSIKFESVKKSVDAVATVAIDNIKPSSVALRKFDPNDFLRQNRILEKLPEYIDGVKMNSYTFQAFVWMNSIKDKEHLCWAHRSGTLTTYSPALVSMIKNSPGIELQEAREKYSLFRSSKG